MKQTIVHIGTLHAKPEHVENLVKSFEGLKKAPGFISYKCYRDIEDKNKITLVEEWENKEAHKNFENSFSKEEMEQWIGMLSQKPESSYFEEVK